MEKIIIGVDIGGTKISTCIGDNKGKIHFSKRIQTKKLSGWKEGCKAIAEMIHELVKKADLSLEDLHAIGISAPGPLSAVKGMLIDPPNLRGWKNAKIVEELKKTFSIPIYFNNDANAQALAEFRFGKYKNTKNLIYLTCSTGMGGGIIANGKLVQGASDTAGEIGHFVLDIQGPLCPCSRRGCFEIYCGGANFCHTIQNTLKSYPEKSLILEEAKGKIDQIDFIHFEKALRKKDPLAEKFWEEFTIRLAQGIGTILMTLNPEVLILGTIALHMEDLLFPILRKKLPLYAWPMPLESCSIVVTSLGEKISELAGLALALEEHQS